MANLAFPYRLALPALRAWTRLANGMTLGVRVIIEDEAGRLALVRHSYVPDWHFPGGAVERGETAEDAARREAREEAGCDPGALTLLGLYNNDRMHRGDHVALYRAQAWARCAAKPGLEIAAMDWFAPEEARAAASPATRRRLEEIYSGAAADPYW